MKVIVFGLRSIPGIEGGIETHSENLYPLLVQQGVEIEILTRSPFDPGPSGRIWKGIKLIRLWAPKSRAFENILHSLIATFFCALKRPDIVHVHAIGPGLVVPLARLLGLKVVLTHHGFDYEREKWGKGAKFALRLGERLGVRFANRVIAISETIQKSLAEKYNVSAVMISNGVVVPNLATTRSALDHFGLVSGQYVLLVSRMVAEKRHLDLISAFKMSQLEGWKLVLVGSIEDSNAYGQEIKRQVAQEPSIVLTGFQSGLFLQELFSHAGLFVLPSSHEGLPIALLEALSYGLPVLASDIKANRDVGLDDRHYYQLGNLDELSNRLKTSLSVHWDERHINEQRNWVASSYDWGSIALSTLATFEASAG